MKTRRSVAGLGLKILVVGVIAFAGSGYAAESGLSHARVTFTATGTGGMKIVGTGRDLTLENQGQWLVFRAPLRTITTGVPLRDRQMRDKYLEVESFPFVELRLARETLSIPALNGATAGDASGRLSLHGKSKDATVHYTLRKEGDSVKVSASFRIDLRAYGIDVPSFRGLTLNPDVDVDVGFAAIDRAVVADGPAE